MEETGDLKIPEQEGVLTQDMLHAELGDTTILFATIIDSVGNSCISGLKEPTAFK
jgi:hypothetical protein